MDDQDSLTDKWMTECATTQSEGSPSIVDALAVSCLCWHMRQSMLDYLTYQKKLLIQQENLLVKYMIYFPNNLPDMDEEEPWYDTEDDE